MPSPPGFSHKVWKDQPDHTTPLSAAAIEDLEDRVAQFALDTASALSGNFKGPWSSGTTYALGDGVSVGTTNYISTVGGNLNHNPVGDSGAHWTPAIPSSVINAVSRVIDIRDYGVHPNGTDYTTEITQAISDATAGQLIVFPEPGGYVVAGINLNKKVGLWFAPGAELKAVNAIAAHTITVSAAGCRIHQGGVDGNVANNSSTSFVSLYVAADDFRWYDSPYFHDTPAAPVWVHDASEVWLYNPKFRNHQGTSIFAESATGSRTGLHIIDVDIDRSSMSAATTTGYGVQIHRDAGSSYSNIEVTGTIREPLAPTNSILCLEIWGGCTGVRYDVKTYGGTMGVSNDRAHNVTGRINVRAAKSIGLELAYATDTPQEGHIHVVGVIDGADEAGVKQLGGGLSISNTKPSEFVLDVDIDNCGGATTLSRAGKFINADGFTLRGRHRHRTTGSAAFEIINCSNYHYDGNLDGRGDDGVTPTAQDGFDIDQSSNGKIEGVAAHFTRNVVAVYNLSGSGVPVTNVDAGGLTVRDTPTPYSAFSVVATLGAGLIPPRVADKAIIHTANYTLLAGERRCLVDATAGAVTITLPLALWRDQDIWIEKTDSSANNVTVQRQGTTDLIEGATSFTITGQFGKVRLVSDSAGVWYTDRTVAAFATTVNNATIADGQLQVQPTFSLTYILNVIASALAFNTNTSSFGAFYLDPADYDISTQLRLTAQAICGNVAPGVDFTFALRPITAFAGAAGQQPAVTGLGTTVQSLVIASTDFVTNAGVRKTSANFAFPSAGWYALTWVPSAAVATSAFSEIRAKLHLRQGP